MVCRWRAGNWTAVIVALVVPISVSSNQHAPRVPVVTIEEAVR